MFGKNGKLEHITPGMSLATIKLIEALKGGKPGEQIDDAALTVACERDTSVGCKGYPYLQSAIRYCRRHYGVNWERIPKAGFLRCLQADETLHSVNRDRRSISRRSHRAIQKLKNVSNGQLDETTKPQVLLQLAQFGALASFASSDMTKRLASAGVTNATPDPKKLLEAFK